MSRYIALLIVLVYFISISIGCRKAKRYEPFRVAIQKSKPKNTPQPKLGWSDEEPVADVALKFVAFESPRWQKLEGFWNAPKVDGAPTAHLGQTPLGSVIALLPQFQPAVRIKVPLGLPDPNPHIPATNPPTLGRWKLGKELFENRLILINGNFRSCKDCHFPPGSNQTAFDPPSLINCIYNRHQFWDGRVIHLEETLVRSLDDEYRKDPRDRASIQLRNHTWYGIATRLGKYPDWVRKFKRVFGIPRPTLNATAKALATYMRTIMSGNSIYDQANQTRKKRNGVTLKTQDFMHVLNSDSPAKFKNDALSVKELAEKLVLGWEIFNNKGRCVRCHNGPLFTDHDFHNIGIGAGIVTSSADPVGRYLRLPIGMKARKYMGAYRTPSLRALPRSSPYMHNGSLADLVKVVEFYDAKMNSTTNLFLDPMFDAGPNELHRLRLTSDEKAGLYFFLRSLDGDPISPIVAGK